MAVTAVVGKPDQSAVVVQDMQAVVVVAAAVAAVLATDY